MEEMKTTLFSKLDTIDFEEITNKNISNGKDTRITMDGKKKKVEDMIIHEVKIRRFSKLSILREEENFEFKDENGKNRKKRKVATSKLIRTDNCLMTGLTCFFFNKSMYNIKKSK